MNTVNPDPWKKTSLRFEWRGHSLEYDVPHDVFSTQWIDEGTRLLLDHLPTFSPRRILDLGCGYGALGLPVAKLNPSATTTLVDRDLLAVKWSRLNAYKNGLSNVLCMGSLGFDALEPGQTFDWILCNVPARIGPPFMKMLLEEGNSLLNSGGELRMVIIRDLLELLETTARNTGLELRSIATGPRHLVLGLNRSNQNAPAKDPDLYLRDRVEVEDLILERPFDLGGDDPKRLKSTLPLFFETLPRNASPGRILCVKSAYGAVPIFCHRRWPEAELVTFDRDLLGVRFTKKNFARIFPDAPVKVLESPGLTELPLDTGLFDLLTYEISPSIGPLAVSDDLKHLQRLLTPTGSAHLICTDRTYREFLRAWKGPGRLTRIAGRDGQTVLQMTR
jgi:16S rRNA (guanine1207-N2)-methyltransferase